MNIKELIFNKLLLCLVIFVIGSSFVFAYNLTFVDVSYSSTGDSACIFKLNNKTVVVYEKDSMRIDGVIIYVKNVYAVNSKNNSDACDFMVNAMSTEKRGIIRAEDRIAETMERNTTCLEDESDLLDGEKILLFTKEQYDEYREILDNVSDVEEEVEVEEIIAEEEEIVEVDEPVLEIMDIGVVEVIPEEEPVVEEFSLFDWFLGLFIY